MRTVEERVSFTTEVKHSKFIAYLIPISESEGVQEKLKKKNPKANHVVYALRYLNDLDQIVENSSDDGEPKGCAGVPVLNVLRGEKLINCAVYIVRYFGGIKLGTGGMARAYALAMKNVLAASQCILYEKQITYVFHTTYSDINKTAHTLKVLELLEYERDFGVEKVVWKIHGSEDKIIKFKNMTI